ncbi:hypothetical protein [Paragemmobacter aquarius]|nr:hypothetical protein [Gemmobacter aquarius]
MLDDDQIEYFRTAFAVPAPKPDKTETAKPVQIPPKARTAKP